MSLNLRQIRYFVAAAEAGKVVAAASAVGISPSAITEAIQELEETVGTPLMTRHRGGVKRLTVRRSEWRAGIRAIVPAM